MRQGRARRRRSAVGGSKGPGPPVEEGNRDSQGRASRQGEGPLAGDRAERASGGMALALAGRLPVTEGAVRDGARAILESGRLVRRGVGEGPRRQQDLQSQRQGEKHNRNRVASHPFSFAHPNRRSRNARSPGGNRTVLHFEVFDKLMFDRWSSDNLGLRCSFP